jgi:hypothetical protein
VSLRSAEEGEHFVVDDVAYRRCQPGPHERQRALFSEGVLYRRRELSQFGDLVLVDLIEGDEQPGLVLDEEIGDEFDLAAEGRFRRVTLARAPRQTTG